MSVTKYILFSGLILLTLDACGSQGIDVRANVIRRGRGVTKRQIIPQTNVTKSTLNPEHLGEYQQTKSKPKKRLALPVNYKLKAVAENDDYYDKGLGENEGEENFDKKEWSDVNRQSSAPETTQIEEKKKEEAPTEKIEKAAENEDKNNEEKDDNSKESKAEDNSEDEEEDEQSSKQEQVVTTTEETEATRKAKERKAKVLNEVDELKMKHAYEQRILSDKIKHEEDEEKRREKALAKKRQRQNRKKKVQVDYDEYDNKSSNEDKYQINTSPKYTRTTEHEYSTSIPRMRKRTRKPKPKYSEIGKQSVFKNPKIYIDRDIVDTADDFKNSEENDYKHSSTRRYNPSTRGVHTTEGITAADSKDNIRISLVPQGKSQNDPSLFYPKKRKQKRRRKPVRTTAAPDAFVAETIIEDKKSLKTLPAVNITGQDAVSTNSDRVADAVPASTEHKKGGGGGGGNFHHEKGKMY